MAARRLAISSLLCADDDISTSPPPGSAAPQSSPHHPPAQPLFPPEVYPPEIGSHVAFGTPRSSPNDLAITNVNASPNHDVVPLSLQPVQLRRHTPSPHSDGASSHHVDPRFLPQQHSYDRAEGLRDTPAGSAAPIEGHEYAGYGRQHRLQAETSHNQFPTPGSEPYYSPSHPIPSTSYSIVRPSSSRSAHSDSPSASYSHRYPPLHVPQSQSPTRSPASLYGLSLLQRHPSHSPVLSNRPVPASPVNSLYSLPPSQSSGSAYPTSQSYYSSMHSSSQGVSLLGSSSPSIPLPGQQLAPIRTSQMQPLQSQLTPQAEEFHPIPRNASAASLPNILNTPSPSSRSGGLGGLEALAQAATQERRRLSSEMAYSGQAPETLNQRLSRSPVIERSAILPEVFQQGQAKPSSPVAMRSPLELRRDIPSHMGDGSVIPANASSTDEGPPAKRRRSSGEFSSGSPTAIPQPSASSPKHTSPVPVAEERKASHSPVIQPVLNQDSRLVYHHPGVVTRALQVTTISVAPHSPSSRKVEAWSFDTRKHTQGDESSAYKPVEESSLQEASREIDRREFQEKKEKKKREPKKEKAKGVQPDHSSHAGGHPQEDGREQDPHDYLLKQYSVSPRTSSSLPAAVKNPNVSPFTLRPAFPDQFKGDETAHDPRQIHDAGASTVRTEVKKARRPTRTPTPLSILEQELADVEVGEQTGPKKEAHESDVSMELDLAVGSASMERTGGSNDQMDLDVEDELLSLLDDQPRPSRPKQASGSRHPDSHVRPKQSTASRRTVEPFPAQSPSDSVDIQRESMPPPASPNKDGGKPGPTKTTAVSGHRKKDAGQKPAPKAKAPPKGKGKSTAKAKPKVATAAASPASGSLTPSVSASSIKGKKVSSLLGATTPTTKRSVSATVGPSRSRSASILPGGPAVPDTDSKGSTEEVADGGKEQEQDDKLYCVCKTSYDEDRVMIACDRCDEWYHTQCVNMPDLEVDLVDQFICPPCVESNPHLRLKTTYKRRCASGLKHPNPLSPSACHKPARGAFSKYCSDECGISYVQSRIDTWNGEKGSLWNSVKDARKREGVVVRVKDDVDAVVKMHDGTSERTPLDVTLEVVKSSTSKVDRETNRLNGQLTMIAHRRDEYKKEMEMILWREKLIELATARADDLDECGWDQRLCFGDEEYAEFGAGVLESYEDIERQTAKEDGDAMQIDGYPAEDGEWWCKGKKKCDRHAGWQKLRSAEVQCEKEATEALLAKLTAEEREIRKQIEDVADPKARTSGASSTGPPLQPLNGDATLNGASKAKPNGDATKKGKKKKN